MNPMILGRGFAMGVVIPVITLVTGILSRIPVFTITGKRKAVSGMVTVVPVCLTGAAVFIACSGLGYELLKDALARMVLVLLGVSWLVFALLSSLIEDCKCILEKDGIRFRKLVEQWHHNEDITKKIVEKFERKLNEITELKVSMVDSVRCPFCKSENISICKRNTLQKYPVEWLKIDIGSME